MSSRTSEGQRAGPPILDPAFLKTCCADLWSHPGVRVLLGDHLHPGARALTERTLDLLALPEEATLLDVGSGPGAGAGVAAERGCRVVAVDLSTSAVTEAAEAPGVAGVAADAERLPLSDEALDGVLAECVLSAIPGKEAVAREVHRVLRPGSPFVLTDVTRQGSLPADLDSLMGWIACAGGALPLQGYARLLEDAGFTVERLEDHREALGEFLAQVRRRLALFQGALAAGVVNPAEMGIPTELLGLGQRLLEIAAAASADGSLSYALILARA
ncbi:MAG TPA: methyltransferase domain-containing protein [Actinomycetota bacterium]